MLSNVFIPKSKAVSAFSTIAASNSKTNEWKTGLIE
jgi:hypothetical protein